ncbi:LolA-like protein [Phaeacidiphilus oryzae]|jgi:hypothetical protein|uniref:hypothetical protein n=1 Tax=Phaeacidiphilus oryzae TaxID=348818 RepID=UPI00068F36EB|nr:hypothetical protein [Phaeacidiphilus oryzae]
MARIRIACTALITAAAVAGLGACQSKTDAKAGSADNASASPSAGAGAQSSGATATDALAAVGKSTSGYRSVHMKAVSSIGTTRTTIDGKVAWNPLAEDVTTSVPGLGANGMHMLLSGTTAWAQVGGKWTKMDMSKMLGGGSSSSQDPASMVQLLVNTGDVKKVGQETVDGVSATHWAGTVDVQRMAARSSLPSGVKKMLDTAAQQGLRTEAVDLWADARDLPVRVHTSAQTKQGAVVSTIDYTDYSTAPLKITPPAAG